MEPEDYGYEKVASKGPLTKYEKPGRNGRIVVYHTPKRTLRVNEDPRKPNVVETSPEFFWTAIREGSLFENTRVESAEAAHELAQERVESLL